MKSLIDNLMKGKGIILSQQDLIKKGRLDQSFSLREYASPETLDYIFFSGITETKFYRILIKEFLIYCKIGGVIILKISENEILPNKKIIEELKICCGEKSRFLHSLTKEYILIKKTRNFLNKKDKIDRWSFGIVTNGKRNDWVERQIDSIKAQNIPHYEIIICGTYFKRKEKNCKYIPFNEKDNLGWITKKKNIICKYAKYENLVVLHDRILLKNGWYEGIKNYGNYFEVLSCKIFDSKGIRCGDWITYGNKLGRFPKPGLLEYRDWDKYGYLDGAMYILKKDVWRKVKWDEKLFWNQGEDIKLSEDYYRHGVVIRFNPFSECLTLSWRHGDFGVYSFNSMKLGNLHEKSFHALNFVKFYIKRAIKWK